MPLRCSTARNINHIEVVSQDSADFDVAVDDGFGVDVYVDAIILQLISIFVVEQLPPCSINNDNDESERCLIYTSFFTALGCLSRLLVNRQLT